MASLDKISKSGRSEINKTSAGTTFARAPTAKEVSRRTQYRESPPIYATSSAKARMVSSRSLVAKN